MSARGSLNKVMLIGRLGHEPELKHTSNKTAVITLRLATNEVWKDKNGNNQEVTEWHKVVLWKKLAEIAAEHLTKGSRVYIEGSLRTRPWEDKDGAKRYTTEILGQRLTLLDGKSAATSEAPPEPPQTEAAIREADDVPFESAQATASSPND